MMGLVLAIGFWAGCGVTEPTSDMGDAEVSDMGTDATVDMKVSQVECPPSASDEFILGWVDTEGERSFHPFGEGDCNTIEVQTGIQGGWHLEPAIQAPSDAVVPDLGGMMTWRIFDAEGTLISKEPEFEMFRPFWQDLGGGYTYWGDFVIFLDYPETNLEQEIEIELEVEFDEMSSLEPLLLRQRVILLDEEVVDPGSPF